MGEKAEEKKWMTTFLLLPHCWGCFWGNVVGCRVSAYLLCYSIGDKL